MPVKPAWLPRPGKVVSAVVAARAAIDVPRPRSSGPDVVSGLMIAGRARVDPFPDGWFTRALHFHSRQGKEDDSCGRLPQVVDGDLTAGVPYEGTRVGVEVPTNEARRLTSVLATAPVFREVRCVECG